MLRFHQLLLRGFDHDIIVNSFTLWSACYFCLYFLQIFAVILYFFQYHHVKETGYIFSLNPIRLSHFPFKRMRCIQYSTSDTLFRFTH